MRWGHFAQERKKRRLQVPPQPLVAAMCASHGDFESRCFELVKRVGLDMCADDWPMSGVSGGPEVGARSWVCAL